MSPASFAAWGWRVPFGVSIILLAVSVYIRLKLQESPVFAEMKAQGKHSQGAADGELRPVEERDESCSPPLFGATAGQGVIWYCGPILRALLPDRDPEDSTTSSTPTF